MTRGLLAIVLALSLCSEAPPALADCRKDVRGDVICGRGPCLNDMKGNVFCARSRDGGIVRTLYGAILCGSGQCVATFKGVWLCSTVEDGAVFKDWDGGIRCEGGCEPASVGNCATAPLGR